MLEYYVQVKAVHIAAVIASGSVFLLRGLLLQAGSSTRPGRWAMAAPVRYASYAIDSVLLTAALMLVTMLPHAMFANGWLIAKLSLLVAYVVLGTFALKRGRTPGVRLGCFIAALIVFTCIVTVAHTHDPMGPLRLLEARIIQYRGLT